MKKVLGLSLLVVLLASGTFAATFVQYSYLTSLANNVPGDPGNRVNGCVVYNPDLNAAFVGQYFTGTGSRANMLGWSLNPADPTYGSTTPKYFIRDRMFPNGLQLTALKSVYGNMEYQNGKMYFVADRWGFDNLNMVGRTFCAVNPDGITVTYPYVTADVPLYNVTGVSTSASTIVEDTWGGTQLYAGATTAFLTTSSGAVGFGQFVLPGAADNMLVGVTGIWTDAYSAYTRISTTSADNTTVFSPKIPLRVVTGVWTNAAGSGQNFYTGPGNGFIGGTGQITLNQVTTLPTPAGGDSVWVSYGWTGLDNAATPTGVGTNFYTGGGYDETPCVVWPGASITGSPVTVYAQYSLGQVNPNTGVIKLNASHTPGTMLFVHVGQLQPGHRAVWKYNATTLAAETALNIYGHPVMWEASTVVSVNIATPGIGTTYQIGGFSAPMTDQFMVGKVKGADTGRSRLTYTNYGRTTVGPVASISATLININLAGKPYSGFFGIWTNAAGLGTNFWSSPSPAGWVAITDTTKIQLPGWLPIRKSVGVVTGGTSGFTRESELSVSGTVINTLKAPIVSCSGVWTNAAGLGKNFAASAAYTRDAYTSTDATTVNVTWLPLTAVAGVWTNATGLGFNFYTAPGNSFTAGGVINLCTLTTLGAPTACWVTFTGGTVATVSAPNVITLNGNALPGGAGSAVWSSYVISGIDITGAVTAVGTNFYTGLTGAADTISQKAGGPGGWWSIAIDTPTIYAYVGGINTTLSLGSAFVNYLGEPPDNYNYFNLMDTTGDIILTNPLPGPATSVWVGYSMANGLDILNNRIQVVSVGNTPTLAVGDTVYTCYLKQAGANPYNFTGAGTGGNRSVTANPYGMTMDKDGNYFVTSLWSYNGFCALDASGNNMGRYPMRGSQSQVIRGQISCDTTNGDIYYADGNGIVWRYKKTGPGLDTYVQENEPFYLGACLGTNATSGLRAMSSALRVKTIPSAFDGTPVTLVFIGTPRDNNGTTEGTDLITVMKTDGTVVNRLGHPLGGYATPRGMDVAYNASLTWPNQTQILVGCWAGPAGYGQVMVWQGYAVPVELSRFESIVE